MVNDHRQRSGPVIVSGATEVCSLLSGGTFWLVTGLSILFALAIVVVVAKALYLEQQKRRSR